MKLEQFINTKQISSVLEDLVKVLRHVEQCTKWEIAEVDFLISSNQSLPLTFDGIKLEFKS